MSFFSCVDPSVSPNHGWSNLFERLGVKLVPLLPLNSHPAHLHCIYKETLKLICANVMTFNLRGSNQQLSSPIDLLIISLINSFIKCGALSKTGATYDVMVAESC